MTFTFTGTDETNATCSGLGYNFQRLAAVDLTYYDPLSDSYLYVRPCGIVTAPNCTNSAFGERTSFCQLTPGSPTTVESLMVYSPSEVSYLYLANGVQQIAQNGQFCPQVSGPAVTLLNFICDPTVPASSTAASITGFVQSPVCVFSVNITTAMACRPLATETTRPLTHPPH